MPVVTRWSLVKDLIGAIAFIVLGGVFLREMGDLPPAVSKYPSIIIYLIFALCVILITRSGASLYSGRYTPANISRRAAPAEPSGDPVIDAAEGETAGAVEKFGFPTAFVLVLSFLYVVAMPYIGFTVASAVMMVVFMLVMGIRSIAVLILVPLVEIAFLLYVFEKLLAVFLPDAEWLKTVLGMM